MRIYSYSWQKTADAELYQSFSGVYAHRELEKMCNKTAGDAATDLCALDSSEDIEKMIDGIYNVEFELPNNEVVPARLYFWKVFVGDFCIPRGLVVCSEDEEGNKDALEKYNEKRMHI